MNAVLIKDGDWAKIDGLPCKLVGFTPLATFNGRTYITESWSTPYGLMELECIALTPGTIGAVTHVLDFKRIFAAYLSKAEDEDVIVQWGKGNARGLARLFWPFAPHFIVSVFAKGDYEMITALARSDATRDRDAHSASLYEDHLADTIGSNPKRSL